MGLTACGGSSSNPADSTNPPPTVTAPSITAQPQNAAANAGNTATFSVAASGTAPLSYQWLKNGQAISGATSASYTTGALSAGDNGASYAVTVSNSAGSQTSSVATLTVNSGTGSVLANRAWTTGANLNAATGTANVEFYKSGMADDGSVVAIYAQTSGSRLTLFGSVGTPNPAGSAPTWTAQPVALDSGFNFMPTQAASSAGPASARYGLHVAPNGNAFAFWGTVAPCTSTSYAPTSGAGCLYFYGSRYTQSTNSWEPAKLITSSRASYGPPIARINSRGDVAVLYQGWTGSSGETSPTVRRAAVATLASNQTSFTTSLLDWQLYNPLFGPDVGSTIHLGLDESGNILVAGARWPTGSSTLTPPSTDIAAALGTVSTGFASAPSTVDAGAATANLTGSAMGRNGDALMAWTQNNGSIGDSVHAATLTGASGAWTVRDFAVSGTTSGANVTKAAMDDDGTARLYMGCSVRRWAKSTNTWAAVVSLPVNCALTSTSVVAMSRDGNYLSFNAYDSAGSSTGRWASYDASSNTMIHADVDTSGQPVASYVLGLPAPVFGFASTPLLSTSGVGAVMLQVNMDQLPTPAAPLGIGRSGFSNVWGLYLK